MASSSYDFDYFNVSFPSEYVAQVEINRPEKLNAFIEVYVTFWYLSVVLLFLLSICSLTCQFLSL